MTARALSAAALIGAVSGLRSQLGVAAAALTVGPAETSRPAAALGGTRVTVGTAVLSAAELAADKWPVVPSRLGAGPLGLRMAAGGFAATVLASRGAAHDGRRPDRNTPALTLAATAAVGAVAALGAAFAGARWRALAARDGRPDWPAALAEDAVALALAGAACGVAPGAAPARR
ncbi:hypothetical protein [Streptomyces sp. HPF1205]|uniref:hypothetical protein n=1 Tax=Streptomyces sp. HPF1205 TaxID=2873262 RepID=UPI001CED0D0E|nr:hypothetical protein [Streptomyces sp. HPF1205]